MLRLQRIKAGEYETIEVYYPYKVQRLPDKQWGFYCPRFDSPRPLKERYYGQKHPTLKVCRHTLEQHLTRHGS